MAERVGKGLWHQFKSVNVSVKSMMGLKAGLWPTLQQMNFFKIINKN